MIKYCISQKHKNLITKGEASSFRYVFTLLLADAGIAVELRSYVATDKCRPYSPLYQYV